MKSFTKFLAKLSNITGIILLLVGIAMVGYDFHVWVNLGFYLPTNLGEFWYAAHTKSLFYTEKFVIETFSQRTWDLTVYYFLFIPGFLILLPVGGLMLLPKGLRQSAEEMADGVAKDPVAESNFVKRRHSGYN